MADEINNTEQTTVEEEQVSEKTYTQEELDALLQQEGDRRVSMAEKKWAKKMQQQKTLSELDAESRAKAESEIRIQELEEEIRNYRLEKSKNEFMKVLGSRGLDTALVDLLAVGEDDKANVQNIDALEKIINKEVTKRVTEKLGTLGRNPEAGATSSGKLTREGFSKLSLAEQQKLYDADPEYIKALIG